MSKPKSMASEKVHIVLKSELPVSCPLPDQELWSQHPRVFLPIEKTGKAVCPYCSTKFILKDKKG